MIQMVTITSGRLKPSCPFEATLRIALGYIILGLILSDVERLEFGTLCAIFIPNLQFFSYIHIIRELIFFILFPFSQILIVPKNSNFIYKL